MAALITSGDGIATVPKMLAEAMERFADIKILAPPIALPEFTVSVYWHERFHRDPANIWLRSIYLRLF